jgi:MFS family permease
MVPGLPHSLEVLRGREFRLLFAGQAVSGLGNQMAGLALAFAVLEVGGSAAAVGLVLGAGTLALVASLLAGGVVADRTSRRAVMLGADLVRVVSQGATAALLILGSPAPWLLAVLAAASGAAAGFFMPAATGLLPEVVPDDQLQPANALRASAASVGEIVGPLTAGLLVAGVGAGWAVAADAGTFAVSAACLALLRPPERVVSRAASFAADLRAGWRAFVARRWVWTFVAYFGVSTTLWGAMGVLGPVTAERDLGGAAAWGVVLGAFGVGSLVGSLLATRAAPTRPLVFVAGMEALFALPLAFLAVPTAVALLAVGAFVSGLGVTAGESVWESTLQRHIPDESLSRVSSYDWFGSFAFYPLGLAIWGPLASAVGLGTSLWLAFALFIAAITAVLCVPDVWRLTAAPTAPR